MHVECLMCYTCGSVDHPIPSCFSCYRLNGQFRNFAFFLVRQAVRYRYSGIHKFVDMQFCMSSVVCSCDGTRTIHSVNIEL